MKIHIHREPHQIGGNIIEVSTDSTKIILDMGINLDNDKVPPHIDGLFCGEKSDDAVFISHYHTDHLGLVEKVIEGIPFYMGKKAYNILCASNEYQHINTSFEPKFLMNEVQIIIGDITITPFRCDHSAYDSYMFLIEADGKSMLYTGDFRANGRMNYENLLNRLPELDAIIIEGTNLSNDEQKENFKENLEETSLEDIAIEELLKHSGPAFILMSAMNIDRLITIYNVAKKTDRILLQDVYTATICDATESDIPTPKNNKDIRVFITNGNDERYEKLKTFGNAKISREQISKEKYIMCIRSSMTNYLQKLNELQSFKDGILFYGMWKGYLENNDMKQFIGFMEGKGVKKHILHTSGHADRQAIDRIIKKTNPKMIIPVHTQNETWFDRYEENIKIIYDSVVEV